MDTSEAEPEWPDLVWIEIKIFHTTHKPLDLQAE